jgi:hypothetical protein
MVRSTQGDTDRRTLHVVDHWFENLGRRRDIGEGSGWWLMIDPESTHCRIVACRDTPRACRASRCSMPV